MLKVKVEAPDDLNPQETSEWVEALDEIIDEAGPDRASYLLERLMERAANLGVQRPAALEHAVHQYHSSRRGSRLSGRSRASSGASKAWCAGTRSPWWCAPINMTELSAAIWPPTRRWRRCWRSGYNHFFHGSYQGQGGTEPGDFVYFQGHARRALYARAFLEGRLNEKHLENFRHELRDHPGLSSYPHPWLMPDFWQFPTVSMGLGPISAIYQARFMQYLEHRGIIPKTPRKVWAFLGDGETDEPESLGALTLASREKLDNLIFVVNCNLQRLDGPVRGNGSIIQELEAAFRGAGWNVIK